MFVFFRKLLFVLIDFILIPIIGIPCLVYFVLYNFIRSPYTLNSLKDHRVILIHGSGVSGWQWLVVERYLQYRNISYQIANYNSIQKINKSSEDVLKQIECDKKNIIIVGHSQGSLKKYCKQSKTKINIHDQHTTKRCEDIRYIIYNPKNNPHLTEAKKDMIYGSDFIKSLPRPECNIYEVIGLNDFIEPENCIEYGKNVYNSYSGHYFSAVNPFLWFNYIIPRIMKDID